MSPATLGGALFGGIGRTSFRHASMPPRYEGGAWPPSVSEGLGSRGAVRRELNFGRSGDRGLRSGEAVRVLAVSRSAIPVR